MNSLISDQQVAERVANIENLICQKAERDVTLIAVTKGFTSEAINAARKAGIKNFGENYAQEMLGKSHSITADNEIIWHFIGQMQTNKVRKISDLVQVWHSVTSLKLAKEIKRRSQSSTILIQVNIGDRGNQMGVDQTDLPTFLEEIRELELDVRGLMTMGIAGDAVGTREAFSELRRLADEHELVECSMGMSQDLEIALECGATMLRVGTGIFGNRRN
ncbi:MAG: YggS family pyridoxal phosphate-dependent enzyme [Acidimicrobiales bacterium]|jgi:hypothetical protein|nr:YggS family pyridoxal phosphate-dependent enzyme [Acidimicrobiales bacterium]MDP6299431.1 YggS family pyridoxal phosphate-dependent enzyme [Acidimicrobiales bacterium]HJM28105.1 YggS family pyridoxal phosphate-dependent enzyme [Acidimicrobiales bacterium]HJM96730.1 YggS family pyridoxal phosphate-dependent enzyme [Acidimicrobiales bacterium]